MNDDHTPHEGCACCRDGMEAVRKRELENIKQYGWYAHIIIDEQKCPYHVNIHTHHVFESFNHLDFQICFKLDPNILHTILINTVEAVQNGKSFKPGDIAFDIIENYPVTFIKKQEEGRDVLRIIIPDESGCLNYDEIHPFYKEQWN